MSKLTKAQRFALERAAEIRSPISITPLRTAEQLGSSPQVCSALGRLGLLEVAQQSEQYRGERRTYWNTYRITPAGRTALSKETEK